MQPKQCDLTRELCKQSVFPARNKQRMHRGTPHTRNECVVAVQRKNWLQTSGKVCEFVLALGEPFRSPGQAFCFLRQRMNCTFGIEHGHKVLVTTGKQ